jgi:hypothetical protein
VITTDPRQDAVFTVTVDACSTTVMVKSGQVEVRSGGYVRTVSSGERISTEAGPSPSPMPPQPLSNRKKAGLFLGIGGAVAVLLIVLTGDDKTPVPETPGGGCVIILSGTSGGGGC